MKDIRAADTRPTSDTEKEMQVKEQLFRFVIRSRGWISVWFIDYGNGQDPPAGFLNRLSDLPVTLRVVSSLKGDRPLEVHDLETGQDACIASVRIIRWINEYTAEGEVTAYHAPEASTKITGLIEFVDGAWVLTVLKTRVS